MSTTGRSAPDPRMVTAARDGDAQALDALVADALPLVYNIVGRALDGHADVDDVVQETLLRVVRGLSELREPEAFRSWLVAIAVRQVRDLEQDRRKTRSRTTVLDTTREPADPAADFVTAGLGALRSADRRRVVEQAMRWLDPDDRALLTLWWLEEIGELERADLAAALGISGKHTAVRVLRMKEQMQTACMVVRALQAEPGCAELRGITKGWNGIPSPLWRKRVARHVRECGTCWRLVGDLLPVEHVVRGLPFLPLPADLVQRWVASSRTAIMSGRHTGLNGTHLSATKSASKQVHAVARARPRGLFAGIAHGSLVPVSVTTVVVVGGVGAFIAVRQSAPTTPSAAVSTPHISAVSTAAAPSPSASPSHSPSASPSASASPSPSAPASAAPPAVRQVSSPKKGVSVWSFNGVDTALAESGAGWYYTWSTQHSGIAGPAGVGFVPMIWGAGSVTATALAQAKGAGPYLLGFNEPDMSSQSNMTVSQALSLWPQLMAAGSILGSPAVATGAATPGGWLDQFMAGAKARGYRVDFITLHWYGGDFVTADAVGQLESYIQAVYDRYHLPIWLTEYALIDFSHGSAAFPTDQQQADFVTASAKMLSGLSYVQRYAWFALPASDTAPSTGLFRSGPVVTAAGRAFEAAG